MARHGLTGNADVEFFRTVFGDKVKEKDGKIVNSKDVNKAIALSKGIDFVTDGPSKAKIEEQKAKELAAKVMEAYSIGKTLSHDEIAAINSGNDNSPDKVINAGYNLESARKDDGSLTLWGAFQTVTNIVDHNPLTKHRDYKNSDGTITPDYHANRVLYGAGNNVRDIKQIAYQTARELVAA